MPSSPHILLVDDHVEVRDVLVYVLRQICPEATIHLAWRGAAALDTISRHRPDLIITDYQMPVMGGLELVRTLRAQGETIPILVLSSDTSIADAILLAGATAFLPRPFPLPALREILRGLLPHDDTSDATGE